MKPFIHLTTFLWILLLFGASTSCTSRHGQSISLASFTENDVDVAIALMPNSDGEQVLTATFTPPSGYHLYSKDIPAMGVDGLGRPTLLELSSNSQMKATGSITESVEPQAPDFEPRDLLVYPAGPVTLSLTVKLPEGSNWIQDEIQVTYMACSAGQCKPPVEGKIVPVRIPGAEAADIH